MRATPDLRAVVYNAECPPGDLLARMTANVAGIPYGRVLDYEAHAKHPRKLAAAVPVLDDLARRIVFLDDAAPSTDDVAAVADAADARLLILDYLQCLRPPEGTRDGDAMRVTMNGIIALAKGGRGVLAASAVTRDAARYGGSLQAGHGGAYIEHGATDVLTLDVPADKADDPDALPTVLRHHKARNGSFGETPGTRRESTARAYTSG